MSAGSGKRSPSRDRRGDPSIARSANARVQANKLKATRHLLAKCTAMAKSTGEQCRDLAMPNGKCFRHGGATPKGADWHKKQWPNGKRPDAIAKAEAKIRAHAKKAKRRERLLAQMTPDERAAHEAWHRSHRPTSPADRARARADRAAAVEIREMLAREPAARPAPKASDLEKARDFLHRQSEAIARRQAAQGPKRDDDPTNAFQGAFS